MSYRHWYKSRRLQFCMELEVAKRFVREIHSICMRIFGLQFHFIGDFKPFLRWIPLSAAVFRAKRDTSKSKLPIAWVYSLPSSSWCLIIHIVLLMNGCRWLELMIYVDGILYKTSGNAIIWIDFTFNLGQS